MKCAIASVLVSLSLLLTTAVAGAQTAPVGSCSFQNGFATMDSMIPQVLGACLASAHASNAYGDTMQETSNGLLTWTKATDVSEFTDGHSTWVLSAYGLILRDASIAYTWEGPTSVVAGVAVNAQGQRVDPITGQVLPKYAHPGF